MASTKTRLHIDPRRLEQKCSTWKVGFATKGLALDAAERQMERGQVQPGCHIVPYECDRCPEWHLTNRVIVPMGRRRLSAWVG